MSTESETIFAGSHSGEVKQAPLYEAGGTHRRKEVVSPVQLVEFSCQLL